MLGRALDTTWRNFSTLFLLGAVFFVPIHLGHAYVFRDELAVQELRPEIEELSENQKVRNVGPSELARERATLVVVLGVDLLICVGLYGASRRVHVVDSQDGVPTVGDALRGGRESWARPDPGVSSVGIVIAALAGWLVYRIASIAAEALGASSMFVGVGLARGVAVSTFFALAIGCAAAASRTTPRRSPKVELY